MIVVGLAIGCPALLLLAVIAFGARSVGLQRAELARLRRSGAAFLCLPEHGQLGPGIGSGSRSTPIRAWVAPRRCEVPSSSRHWPRCGTPHGRDQRRVPVASGHKSALITAGSAAAGDIRADCAYAAAQRDHPWEHIIRTYRTIVAAVAGAALLATPLAADAQQAKAREFANCTAMHNVYPHGVGKVGAHDKTSGTPVTNFKRSNALYAANTKSDRDHDKIACEKR